MDSMPWRSFQEMFLGHEAPPGRVFEPLSRGDIPRVTRLLRAWHPELHWGLEWRHLEPEYFEQQCYLKGESADRPLCAVLCRDRDDGAVHGLLTLERNARARQLSAVVGVVAPSLRGQGLGRWGLVLLEAAGRSIGAERVLVRATRPLSSARRRGFQLAGVDLAPAPEDGAPEQAPEALYVKTLEPLERTSLPGAPVLRPVAQPHPADAPETSDRRPPHA